MKTQRTTRKIQFSARLNPAVKQMLQELTDGSTFSNTSEMTEQLIREAYATKYGEWARPALLPPPVLGADDVGAAQAAIARVNAPPPKTTRGHRTTSSSANTDGKSPRI